MDNTTVVIQDNATTVSVYQGGTAPDATTTSKGSVQLAGDLGGTAIAPTVPGLAGKANTSHTHPVADLTATGTKDATTFLRGDNTWAVPAGGGSSTARVSFSTDYQTQARYSTSTNGVGASITMYVGGVEMTKGTDATGGAGVNFHSGSEYHYTFDKNPHFASYHQATAAAAGETWNAYAVTGYAGNASGLAATQKHFGYNLKNNVGTQEINLTHADGTTQVVTVNAQNFTAGTWAYVAEMSSATNIKFYVNGILKATHTTSLPTGGFGNGTMFSNVIKGVSGSSNNGLQVAHQSVSQDAR